MIAQMRKPMTYFIVGFGRGGTTILANALSSPENAFCLIEPYHYHSDHGKQTRHDWTASGASVAHLLNGNEPLEAIQDLVGTHGYDLGGYKETIEPVSDWTGAVLPRHLEMVDFFIVILRDPKFMHSSQRAHGWKLRADEPAAYLEDYKFLAELANTYPGIPMTLEDLIIGGLDYLNSRLPFNIVGEFKLEPIESAYGDPAAKRATQFRRPDRACNLDSFEIAEHEEARRIWASFRT